MREKSLEEKLLLTLGSARTLDILRALKTKPMTIREFIYSMRIPPPTLYRRIEELEKLGLVSEIRATKFPFKRIFTLTFLGEVVLNRVEDLLKEYVKLLKEVEK